MKYIQLALWALVVLWKFRTINPIHRLHLWRKTVNLFVCFLAFTDTERPRDQMRAAMLCALLSALYDYDTDWVPSETHDASHFLALLEKEVTDTKARALARDLFKADRENLLSDDGLERGSIALQFYHLLIKSSWMSRYADEEIALFGRNLQIIDDFLDREEDARVKDRNCLLQGMEELYLGELRAFLTGVFFGELAERSRAYQTFQKSFRRHLGERIPLNVRDLLDTTRPITVLFAFAVTCLGFKMADTAMLPGILFAALMSGITGSIMVFNDLCDLRRDCMKGKRIVNDYTEEVRCFYRRVCTVTGTLLLLCAQIDWKSGACAATVWVYGLLYSKAGIRYPWNNLLVALCSGTPVLIGMVYTGNPRLAPWFLFAVIFGMITIREVFKDIEDVETDPGHKDTFPVRVGVTHAALHGGRLAYPVIAIAVCYPNTYVQLVAAAFPFLVSGFYVATLYYRNTFRWRGKETYRWAQRAIDLFLAAYIAVFWFTN